MVMIVDDLVKWLVDLLRDAAAKRLISSVFGTEQERALEGAAKAAVAATALDFRPDGGEPAEHLAMVIGQVFTADAPRQLATPNGQTLLEAISKGVDARLAVLDDPTRTGQGVSSAEVLGIPVKLMSDRLAAHLVEEIEAAALAGGPLKPLADRLAFDASYLRDQRMAGVLARVDDGVRALARAMERAERLSFPQPNSRIGVKIIPARHSIAVGTTAFRYIPPGTPWIGSDNGYEHERPRHRVKQSAFFLQDAPVTFAEFDIFCNATGYRTSAELGSEALYVRDGVWQPLAGATWRLPSDGISPHPNGNDHPVVQVSWYDANIYCRWLAQETGLPVGLPTETQWEYAAGGPVGLRWPFGDTYKPDMANLEYSGTVPVRQFPPNAFGLYDMAGNVYEWCADWYVAEWARAGHALSGAPSPDPGGPGAGSQKILRGGSWFDLRDHCCTANRFYASPILAAANWGFRPCVTLNGDLVQKLISEPGWGLRAEDMLEGN